MKRKYNAFTLIELLIVIVIIGILAGLIIFALRSATLKARDARAKNSVREVQTALETFMTTNTDLTVLGGSGNAAVKTGSTIMNRLVDSATNTRLLSSTPLDGQNKPINVQIIDSQSYRIQGRSGFDASKCWMVATGDGKNNLSDKDPANCIGTLRE